MDNQQQPHNTAKRSRAVTALLIAGAPTTWVAAVLLVWGVVPRLVTDPVLANDADAVAGGVAAFALTEALAGALVLLGLAFAWRAPRRAVGRVLRLVAGLLATATGLQLLNAGTVQAPAEFRWDVGTALAAAASVAAFVVVGGLGCAASLSHELPGQSRAERMMRTEPLPHAAPARELMRLLTAALAVGWIGLMIAVIATRTELPFDGMQFGMPILAGAVVAMWREGDRNRMKTLGLASAAVMTSSCLFLLTQYYRFNPVGDVVWWALIGVLFGAAGYGLWRLLAHWRLPHPATARLRRA